ncbi:MAG TPA: helix-turn-helix domain-containing protein [Candidatus Nanopelagicales bacterium]|nr:helix-turn-helix domain-containing protein [Candidatus Nanopelagicales bacterium]
MSDRELRPAGDTQVLASVSNAARVLKEFGKDRPDLGVSDLARRLGLGKSTTHRLLHTLAVERLLDRDPESGRYRLSPTVSDLGARVPASRRAGWPQAAHVQEGSR